MAFFKSFQHNLPSVNISSILDSVTSRVDDLANAVSDVTYAVSDQLTEQVTTIINKVQDEEEGENASIQESGQTSTGQEGRTSSKSMWQIGKDSETANSASDTTEAEYTPSQLEWEWRDGCWRVKKTEAELAEEERRKKEEKELWEKKEQRRKERRQRQLEKEAMSERHKEESQAGQQEEERDNSGQVGKAMDHGDCPTAQVTADDCEEPVAEAERCWSRQKQLKEEGEEEEERSLEREGDDEKQAELSRSSSTVKQKKSDKKKGKGVKGGSKKSEEALDVEKKKVKGKKSKRKKKDNQG